MFDNIQLSKQHYRKTFREKGFRGFRLQVVESKILGNFIPKAKVN